MDLSDNRGDNCEFERDKKCIEELSGERFASVECVISIIIDEKYGLSIVDICNLPNYLSMVSFYFSIALLFPLCVLNLWLYGQ